MRLRLEPSRLARALLRPEPLLALLLAVAAAVYLLGGLRRDGPRPAPERIEIAAPQPLATEAQEVRLVRFDLQGREVPTFATVEVPQGPAPRLEAVLGVLRREMAGEGWPEGLPVPLVFVEELGRRTVAVLDLRPESAPRLGVDEELRLLRSMRATILENGVDEVRFLLNGEATGVFLQHVAVPVGLGS